jgi:excisionase family DNA binding protein
MQTTTGRQQIAPDAPTYITITQAADALASRPWSVAELIEAGELRAVRFGARTLVSAYDVEQLGGVIAAADQAPPADPDAVAVVRQEAEAKGLTLDELADRTGIFYRVEDLTAADLVRMVHALHA